MQDYINPIAEKDLSSLCERLEKKNHIDNDFFWKYGVKRGLRNADGTGVMAGLTRICSVDGYYMEDGERVPKEGVLKFRGININDIIDSCRKEDRFGFEELTHLLVFGTLPTSGQLEAFRSILAECRDLPDTFIEDEIMKNVSADIMNKLSMCILSMYSYDKNPDEISLQNVLRQCIQLIAQMPVLISYSYQVKRRKIYGKSMYFHPNNKNYGTAETILRFIRSDKSFTHEEAMLLDTCLMLHAEHGGGNNSTFATRVLTSSGTDTYSAISAAIGSLKGPRHGGANAKVCQMLRFMQESVSDITDEGQVADFLKKVINRQAGDGSGLIYGMGHAVYTVSDPRAVVLKREAEKFSRLCGREDEFKSIALVERLTPEIFKQEKGIGKRMCANVDLYSGFVYNMLGIPEDLFTPIFAAARIAGWSAHRIEELLTGGRIIRPAYKNIAVPKEYIPLDERIENYRSMQQYIPSDERF
ncbi:MAG: citrate synthase [Clostridia bacterium]|nr:citrate synthase [Clostridia bacterium]